MTKKPTYEELEQRVKDLEKEAGQHKRVEERIKQQSEFLNLVVEAIPYPFYVIDVFDYTIKMANSATHISPLPKDTTCYALTHKVDRPCVSEEHPCPLEILKETKKPVTVEHVHYDRDGNPRNVEVHAYPIFDSEGNVSQMIESSLDVTDRKQAEEALKEAHEKLEQRVRERTAELVAANKELMRQVEARKGAEERVRGLSQQLIMAQEIERQRLSSDLHDNLAQDLSSLKIGLDTLFDNEPEASPETRQRASELTNMLHGSIMAVRNLAYNLRPASLDQIGMVRAVREHCKEFSAENKVKVDFVPAAIDNIKLDLDTKITLYRLVQEALNNVKKHADASHVTVRLVASFPNIILRIEDNGKGFDVQERLAATLNEKRMGLRSMEERVGLLQGKMRIESQPMQGTNIVVEVPYKRKENGE